MVSGVDLINGATTNQLALERGAEPHICASAQPDFASRLRSVIKPSNRPTPTMADSTMSVTDTASQADETVESLPSGPQADAGMVAHKASRLEKRRYWQSQKLEAHRTRNKVPTIRRSGICNSCKRDKQRVSPESCSRRTDILTCDQCERDAEDTKCRRCERYSYNCSFDDQDQAEDESRSRRTLDLVKCDSCRTSKQKVRILKYTAFPGTNLLEVYTS
jgi:hypothetical protein